MSRPKIVIVGSCNTDLIAYTNRFPKEGETIKGSSFEKGFGGKGANQATAACKLGGEVYMVGKVGKDSYGRETKENFEKVGVNTTYLFEAPEGISSGVALITVDASGSNQIVIVGGANEWMSTKDIEEVSPLLKDCDWLLCQLEIPLEVTLAAMETAHSHGKSVLWNPTPIPEEGLPSSVWKHTTVVCVNQPELALLTSVDVNSLQSMDGAISAAKKLLSQGPKVVVVTLGSLGSLWVSEEGEWSVGTKAPGKVIDTTGAGDCFVGALTVAMAEGLTPVKALERANAAAALSVTRKGTQTSFPLRKELNQWNE